MNEAKEPCPKICMMFNVYETIKENCFKKPSIDIIINILQATNAVSNVVIVALIAKEFY